MRIYLFSLFLHIHLLLIHSFCPYFSSLRSAIKHSTVCRSLVLLIMRSSASTEVEYYTHNSLLSICPLTYSLLSPSLTTHSLSSISLPDPSSSIAGIPRPVPNHETEVQAILSVPCVAAVTPAYEHETEFSVQVAQY